MDPYDLVIKILKEECEVSSLITKESHLQNDLQLDSMGLLILMTSLENHYQKRLGEVTETSPQTVGEIVTMIEGNES